jgi:glycosyltransferase involved in cell wall biosynthesis
MPMFKVSLVTMNRKAIFKECLDRIIETTRHIPELEILVTDQGSTDGTAEMLRDYQSRGLVKAWLLPENVGVAKGRNAHWAECVGFDTLKVDDKVFFETSMWAEILHKQSVLYHCCVGLPYDATVRGLWGLAPLTDFIGWSGAGEGGPFLYVPGEVSSQLGGWDEIPGLMYGWEDILYFKRAEQLGWLYGFSLRVPCRLMAEASEGTRKHAMAFHDAYVQRLEEYTQAERDLLIPIRETEGYAIGQTVRWL